MNLEKEIICSEISYLSREDKITILSIVKKYDRNKIQNFPDGSRIDLDSLPDWIINAIYCKIKYILKLDS
jgi:hypothetical protein